MAIELALLYLDLDLNGLLVDSIGPHLITVEEFIVQHFKDINKAELQEELLKLALVGVVVVLLSDHFQVSSEDDIYDFMLKWVQTNYSDQLEEGKTVLNTLVCKFLRFPLVSTGKLECILTCCDIKPGVASELALGALRYFKAQPPHEETLNKVMKRAYKKLPLKVVAVDSSFSYQQCVVYLDLQRDECENISHMSEVETQDFLVRTAVT